MALLTMHSPVLGLCARLEVCRADDLYGVVVFRSSHASALSVGPLVQSFGQLSPTRPRLYVNLFVTCDDSIVLLSVADPDV
jgi:hypothetical protein